MVDQASDFLKDYQTLAQQSWDAWTRYLQQQAAPASFGAGAPFAGAANTGDDLMARSMAALKGYSDWLQGAASSGLGQAPMDWQQSLQSLFSTLGGQPFGQAFASIDSEAAKSFAQLWQSWMQSSATGAPGMKFDVEHMAAFGYTRERQRLQQALAAAVQDYTEWAGKYQTLIQRANTEGFERLQAKLAELGDSAKQIESLKALYDMWVDAAEEAYGQIALSEEFRHAYGEMVNAQGRVRQLQQQQLDALCRDMGLPTRSEVTALGKRMHELRREVRGQGSTQGSDEIAALRAEVAALRRQLAGKPDASKPVEKKSPPRSSKRAAGESINVGGTKKTAAAVAARKTVARGVTRTRK
ncbi:poly(R)-hydroxyalkanoic acid synthase subunit PhaE [Dyella telluris]|uniref:Poly(3-hydroxyalkanoate) polymerase subunit PhaE n=1 Tax=Dyella telluris TaxID=2763498 RepID=A0A7G8Q277_9GAMM|nr:poly(R)-hydroxyalkanoic acid synthase subunit PhaE [Dyella telluris]QNK00885.1 pha synthase subunit protein [Dyella telluris]